MTRNEVFADANDQLLKKRVYGPLLEKTSHLVSFELVNATPASDIPHTVKSVGRGNIELVREMKIKPSQPTHITV